MGKRWEAPEVKQHYQQMAEEGRQKYDKDMAAYRKGNYTPVVTPPVEDEPKKESSGSEPELANKITQPTTPVQPEVATIEAISPTEAEVLLSSKIAEKNVITDEQVQEVSVETAPKRKWQPKNRIFF